MESCFLTDGVQRGCGVVADREVRRGGRGAQDRGSKVRDQRFPCGPSILTAETPATDSENSKEWERSSVEGAVAEMPLKLS